MYVCMYIETDIRTHVRECMDISMCQYVPIRVVRVYLCICVDVSTYAFVFYDNMCAYVDLHMYVDICSIDIYACRCIDR